MSKKKRKEQPAKKSPEPKKRGFNPILIGAIGLAIVVAAIVIVGGSSVDSSPEGQYVGRLLPDGYEAPQVADSSLYTSTIGMTDVTAAQAEGSMSVALADVVANKIVRFDYTRASGESLPMIAYVRPSGRVFVGVSYCPPCEGEGQRIEADGTLTCESCGTRRNLEDNTGLSGACKLYPLDEVPVTVDGDSIVVDGAVLDSWTAQPLDRPIG